MDSIRGRLILLSLAAAVLLAQPARAVVPVVWGQSWDGSSYRLQSIVDALYGAGQIDVTTDYLGAKPGDPDPWFWVDGLFSALLVKEVAGNAHRNQVGWFHDLGTFPVLVGDGVNDGLIFDGPATEGDLVVVNFQQPMTRFSFYLNPNGPSDATNAPEPEKFYTNRNYNDAGPDGSGALHVPLDGDVQALVFDVSRFKGPNTWLVCFEDLDSGANPGAYGQAKTDNDFNDFLFEVTAFGAVPVQPLSMGSLKARYAR